ncbi:hypothetical protein M5K25_005770 [Dendrobium thyrsiflorum]|uniref:Acidic leucine-rich nuclear phosphoprotein 32-related protein n=1 Tax=Dendrobium thyrsiflorum TaxID=117978 RepID=A0ABD0VIQ4_DENTH
MCDARFEPETPPQPRAKREKCRESLRQSFSLLIACFVGEEQKEVGGISILSQISSVEVPSWMDEVWERAVEAKLEGQATPSSELRVLNLDGAVKSLHGCLPPAGLLERFPGLEHLSIANVGATTLERFPRLRNLQRLILSDNRIAGGLESLVDAGLQSLRDLDLSNNRIQHIEDLAPLAALHLVSLDLYECPVTRVKDYRSKVFAMIRTLKYLDKLDANENERPESDDEEEEEDEEEYDDDEEDSGSGEVDGGDQTGNLTSGARNSADGDEGIVDADEDEGSDADEEEIETNGRRTGSGSSVGSEEDELGVEDRDVEEEDYGESEDEDDLDGEYLVQPIARSSWPDSSVGNEEDEIDYEDENRPSNGTLNQSSSSSDANKRKRDEESHLDKNKTEERRPSKRR